MKFKTGIEQYCRYLAMARRAEATIESYKRTLDRVCGEMPRGTNWEKVTVEAVLDGLSRHKSASATRNREVACLRSFSRWAFEAGHAQSHRLAGLPRQRGCGSVARALGETELEAFFGAMRGSEDELRWRDEALFALYASTGLRRTEAVELRWKELDTERGQLRVLSSKTGRSRVLQLGPRILALLERYRVRCKGRPEGAVFEGRTKTGALGVWQINDRFRHWSREAGLEDGGVGPMRLRVSFATMLYEQSGDVALVAQSLGHRDVRTRLRYVAVKGDVAGAGERLMKPLGLG